ncbi:hypothetical protein N0V83_001640 [Neocucurbitaria cava]|uniref:Uncharacterized protein n=1 Tax=Neocucurbitaria cava TaxID=798079 RepID=A0A9W9CQL1_9PLEO|nr:hypothetical protein N0V83_001640 [Neocucurbitaria cava]
MILRPARVFKVARMLSTFVGQSGREYKLHKVLQRHPKKPEVSVCLALCNYKPFVLKPVSQSIFDHLQEFRTEFGSHPRLRNHIDQNEKDSIVFYEYFKTDLLSLCLYVITGVQSFNLNFDEIDTEPEVAVLFKLLATFGPLPDDALVTHVKDMKAGQLLTDFWQVIWEREVRGSFVEWEEDVFPNLDDGAKRLILRMTKLDPARRAPMSDIGTDAHWGVDEGS